jgi:hypothetical protein
MRPRLGLLPIALAALLAGCGSPSSPPPLPTVVPTTPTDNGIAALPPEEIVAKAQAALGTVGSYRMSGTITAEGRTATIDLHNGGKNVKGTIEIQGQALEILRISDDLYMKASDAFWKQFIPAEQHSAIALLSGKYVKVDATNESFSSLTEAFDASEIIKTEDTVTVGTPTVINGTPAIGLVSQDKTATLYIATIGEPKPLRIESKSGQGKIDFTDFDEPIDFAPPASSEVFDLKSIMGGG